MERAAFCIPKGDERMFTGIKGRCWGAVVVFVIGIMASNSFAANEAKDSALDKALAQVKMFAGLTNAEKDALKSAATLRHVNPRERLTEKDKVLDRMFILLEGQAEVWVNGKLVTSLSGQSLIGEMEFLNNLPVHADVFILKETDIIELNNAALTDLMEKQPRLGYVIMREIAIIEAQRLRETTTGGRVSAGQYNEAIDKVRLDFNAAYSEGNAQMLAGLITPDGIWMPPGEPTVFGQGNIKTRYAKLFTSMNSKFELKAGDIQLLGDWAYLSGDWSSLDTPKAGGSVKSVSGHYLLIVKKQPDGSWKITRDIWNEVIKP
jgi:uncharacterized protein (TIGR02246 family)